MVKKHSVSDTARTASLTDLRRWPGDRKKLRELCCEDSISPGPSALAREPVLGEPVLIGRAIKRGWGEPSNEVGASHQTRLGEPVLSRWASHSTTVDACFKAAPWRYGASARARSALLGTFSASSARARSALHLHGASTGVPTFLQVPARHCACSARARSAHLVTSASSARARSALHLHGASTGVPTFLQVPARHWGACSARARSAHLVTSARSALCQLGTCPLGTSSY